MYYTVFYIVVQLGVASLRHPSSAEGEASRNALVILVSGRIAWHMTTTRGFPVTQEAPRIICGTVCSAPRNQRNQRSERLMAEMMAFSELVTIEVSMPTPHTMLVLSSSPIWHST